MSGNCNGNDGTRGDSTLPSAGERGAAGYLTNGLRLAAAPTFSVMALLAGLPSDGAALNLLCLTADRGSAFSGMVPMYLLMSAFHLPPWLELLFSQGNGADRA